MNISQYDIGYNIEYDIENCIFCIIVYLIIDFFL
jgi:hypothetical protein